jgi:hypothetical protein
MKTRIIALSVLFAASAGYAQPPAGGGAPGGGAAAGGMPANEQIFANNHSNGDGEITHAEAHAAALPLSQNWDAYDLNSDGKVVAAELDTARGTLGGGRAGGPPAGGRAGGPPAGAAAAAAPAAPAAPAAEEEEEEEDEE